MNNLTPAQRQQRMNIRNFFLTATREELQTELENRKTQFEKDCIAELIAELE